MFEQTSSTHEERVDRSDQGGDRPPQRSPGGVVNSPVSLIARRPDWKAEGVLPVAASSPPVRSPRRIPEAERRERHRSYVAHPSNGARVRELRSGVEEQASVPQAGHQGRVGGTDVMRDWLEQEVINEVEARRRNEWIEQANERFGAGAATDEYTCECSDSDCTVTISLSREEYESVRGDGTLFAIAVDHENPLIDLVVAEHGRYAVVQKYFGAGRRMADESNPRG